MVSEPVGRSYQGVGHGLRGVAENAPGAFLVVYYHKNNVFTKFYRADTSFKVDLVCFRSFPHLHRMFLTRFYYRHVGGLTGKEAVDVRR